MDPRVRRTRQLLLDALERLLETKSIEQLSVQDITEAATLNRATFYDHYTDKFELLEGLVETQFQRLMNERGVVFDGSCHSALLAISLATCDYLAALPGIDCAQRRQMEKHFEGAIIAVVRGMILFGLKRHGTVGAVPYELMAACVSGAIYGGAREWVRTPDRMPVAEAAKSIFAMVGPMMAAA